LISQCFGREDTNEVYSGCPAAVASLLEHHLSNDLNDLYYFAKIVEHGSLSAAGAALGVAKSVLSQHLTKLEAELGVRLIQRSTRRLQITELGQRYYERCRAVVAEAENAKRVIEDARGVPSGRVRVSCPTNFAQVFAAGAIVGFLADHPHIEVTLDASNRDIDVLADGYDLVIRVGTNIKSSNLIVRSLTVTRHWLLASPALIARCGTPRGPDDLKTLPSVGGIFPVKNGARHLWRLEGPRGQRRTIAYRPRFVSEDLFVLKEAVLAGCGVADLPPTKFKTEIAEGRLIRLVPKWQLPEVSIYALYPSREGLPLAVRMLVDDLMANLDRWNRSLTVNSIQIKAPNERIVASR
jgi:DNA-binding transcriptional LysR family regulator